MSQVEARPAPTRAPEVLFETLFGEINVIAKQELGIDFFRTHDSIHELITSINRFRALDEKGLFALAKDISRVIIESLNEKSLEKTGTPPKDQKLGSLKKLEYFLSKKISLDAAKEIVGSLVGIYELRNADSHLPQSSLDNAFNLV